MGEPLIILGSARKNGDTCACLQAVLSDTAYQLTDLLDYSISPYTYSEAYPEADGFMTVVAQMVAADTIVLATPVYWYAMSGLMKNFFDRLTDLVTRDKTIGRQLKDKSIFLFAIGSDDDMPPGFEVPFQLTADYFGATYRRSLYICTKKQQEHRDEKHLAFLAEVRDSCNAHS